MVQLPWKTVWWFFKNLNIESPHDPAIPLLGMYPKELKTGIHTDACTGTFITALFAIVKRRNNTNVYRGGINTQIVVYSHNRILFNH